VTCGRQVVSPGTPVSSTNKTDHQDITEILLKVASNTIKLRLKKGANILESENIIMYQVRRRSNKSNSGYTSAVSPNHVLFTGSKYCISILTKQM
jgi:hypothetical protein